MSLRVLDRRTFLRGAGGVSIALPFLDAMLRPGRARAAGAPQRFLVFFSPGGTVLADWLPNLGAGETDFRFPAGKILESLDHLRQWLVIPSGLTLGSKGPGHPHSRGMGGVLTGDILSTMGPQFNTNGGNAGFSNGTSIDQVIGRKIGVGTKFKTLETAIRWPTDGADGKQSHPWNTINYAGPLMPVAPSVLPRAVFDRLFTDLSGSDTGEQMRSKTILDAVKAEYSALMTRLGAADRAKLDQHLGGLRELETSLTDAVRATASRCVKPTFGPELDGPQAGGSPKDVTDGYAKFDRTSDNLMPVTGKLMMDLMVTAMACDLTRVGTIQWTDSQAIESLPFLKLNGNPLTEAHHGYQHDRGYQPDAIKTIENWYASQFAYLLDRMAATKEADGTSLLDNTLVLWCKEIQHPNSHAQDNMPFVLAGGARGKLKTGRFLKFTGRSHHDLLSWIQNAFGIDGQSYGLPEFNKGPLPL